MTDKQPQTCYVPSAYLPCEENTHLHVFDDFADAADHQARTCVKELEAQKKEWQREAAEKAFEAGEIRGDQNCEFGGDSLLPNRKEFLDQNYQIE